MATGIRKYKSKAGPIELISADYKTGAIVVCGKFDGNSSIAVMQALMGSMKIGGEFEERKGVAEIAFHQIPPEKMDAAVGNIVRCLHKNSLIGPRVAVDIFRKLEVDENERFLWVPVNLNGDIPEHDEKWRELLESPDWKNSRSHHYPDGIPSPRKH